MANEKHLDILVQGVDTWNDWRRETSVTPDLSKADLTGVDLSGAYLKGANLKEADLEEVNLGGADLGGTDLDKANLSGANLSGAYLTRADISQANLVHADLKDAGLLAARLSLATLIGVNLHNANLGHTVFFRTKLQKVKGLDTIEHHAPSSLDRFTIAMADSLPVSFLRGCGLPDLIINNIDVFRGDAVQFYSCFISYSSENQDFAERLHADLQDEGVRCWFAPQEVEGGKKLHEQINEAIRVHDKLVLILSEASMESEWVEHEVRQARQRERKEGRQVLFPVALTSYSDLRDWTLFDADEGRDLAREVREYYIPNFSDWKKHDAYQEAFDELIRGLRAANGG